MTPVTGYVLLVFVIYRLTVAVFNAICYSSFTKRPSAVYTLCHISLLFGCGFRNFLARLPECPIVLHILHTICKGKGKAQPITSHEFSGDSTGIFILFFNRDENWGGWSTPRPGCFTQVKRPGKHFIGSREGTGPVWNG